MAENTSLLPKKESTQTVPGGRKVKVAQGAVLITITLERIAFYSLAGNLVFFLNKNPYQWKSYNSMFALFFFFGISYLTSFFGGVLADTVLGRFKSLLLSFFVYLIGYSFLPFLGGEPEQQSEFVSLPKICGYSINHTHTNTHSEHNAFTEDCSNLIFGVLTLIAIGSGPFRSNIAPFGADQVRGEGQQTNLTFFNWYYWCVNVGSLIALLVVTYVQQYEGFYYGYLSSLICLAVSAFIFLCGSCSYVYRPRTGSVLKNIFKVLYEAFRVSKCFLCCRGKIDTRDDDTAIERPNTCLDYAKYRYGGSFQESTVDEVKKVLKVTCVFLTLIPYWMVYFQMETTFLIQGLHMNLNLPGHPINKSVSCSPQNATGEDDNPDKSRDKSPKIVAAWFAVVDIAFVIILIPVFDRVIYPWLAKSGRPMGFVIRVSIGMAIAATAVFVAGVVEHFRLKSVYQNITAPCCRHTVEQKIGYTVYNAAEMSILWQIPQYALIGLSEVFASIAALEFAYQMAPKSAKGVIMGLFYLSSGVGSLLGVASVSIFEGVWFGTYDSGNINCKIPCTEGNGGYIINQQCHLDFYFFFLAGIELVGLLLFFLVVRMCQIQKEISTVLHNKPQQPIHISPQKRLRSPISVQRQASSSDISVT